MCCLWPPRPRHPEEDDTSWLRLQRALNTLLGLRLQLLAVLGLGLLLGPVIQELARALPVKSIVFDDNGLLLSAFTTTRPL